MLEHGIREACKYYLVDVERLENVLKNEGATKGHKWVLDQPNISKQIKGNLPFSKDSIENDFHCFGQAFMHLRTGTRLRVDVNGVLEVLQWNKKEHELLELSDNRYLGRDGEFHTSPPSAMPKQPGLPEVQDTILIPATLASATKVPVSPVQSRPPQQPMGQLAATTPIRRPKGSQAKMPKPKETAPIGGTKKPKGRKK